MKRVLWIAIAALAGWAAARRAGASVVTCAEPEILERPLPGPATGELVGELTVVSINLAKETDAGRIAAELLEKDILERADVLSLQEVTREEAGPNVAERLALRLGMNAIVAGAGVASSGEKQDAVALLSRRPMRDPVVIELPRYGLGIRSRCRVALAATVSNGGGGVRVVGLHLDTRVNAESRRLQLAPVVENVAGFKGPVVLAGDFNTNAFWWFQHLVPVPFVGDQPRALYDHLTSLGFQSPFSPGGQPTNDFLWLQLDWVFLRGLEALQWGVEPVGFSDHHAVWVRTRVRHG
jgi:endonuclease/exonuclease/phosphatase family metal-dependent hydrolase